MKRSVIGILAHVDAGKTTLAEAILYRTGAVRRLGRVDNGSTALDTHDIERRRGITIFASQAEFTFGELSAVLLDTPGHADFAAEAERTLSVIDYAVLVISASDGVQAHTRTLWRLLEQYSVPVFVFVSKNDLGRRSREELMSELKGVLSEGCADFDADTGDIYEKAALCSDEALEKYLSDGKLSDSDLSVLIAGRKLFPCIFGSGLRGDGVERLLGILERYIEEKEYPSEFGARVYKISYDEKGTRLTHMKITGGTLRVRDRLGDEKASQIRRYSGAKFTAADEAAAGTVCAVAGLEQSRCGSGYGFEQSEERHILEPVMKYRLILPEGCDPRHVLPKLRRFEEEDPLLKIEWNSFLQEIDIALMGEVQTEVLRSLIAEKLDIDINVDLGRVMYKETIAAAVEGAGHFEPLRHYAEVHLLLSPAGRGEGLIFDSKCSEDELDRNWQRLILTHLAEKEHIGVLTGSPVTDIRITLIAGCAHLKHTEGGDFRQATYRAVRQGLMKAISVLLEPYYDFTIEVPAAQAGKAMSDIRMRSGEAEISGDSGGMTVIKGSGPVSTLNDYAAEVAAYTSGHGTVMFSVSGYRECHNAREVIEAAAYSPEADAENTADSVFCSHGAGHPVKWDEADSYMHIKP